MSNPRGYHYRYGHKKKSGKMRPQRRMDCRQASWQTFYWLGIEASKQLTPDRSYAEIGRAVGLSKQNTFTACMLALGKVVFALREKRRTID